MTESRTLWQRREGSRSGPAAPALWQPRLPAWLGSRLGPYPEAPGANGNSNGNGQHAANGSGHGGGANGAGGKGASASAPAPGDGQLSQLAVRGGAYLLRREGIGMFIRLGGVVVTVREIGPGAYGIYSAALAFVTVAAVLAQMGAEVYLIRQPGELGDSIYNRAYTLLLCTSVGVTAVGLAGTVVLAHVLRPVGVVVPLRVMLLCVPINVLWAPAQAKIERRFGYRQMGWLELGGDFMLYATAVPLSLLGFGAWSLIFGYFAWQTYLLVGSIFFSQLRPRWNWSFDENMRLVRHGGPYSATQGVLRLSGVINALVVGSFAGATGVGYVAFAARLVDVVGFASRSAYRLGLVAMSKVADTDEGRIRFALERGTVLQMLALGLPLAGFGLLSPWLVPAVFGKEWTGALVLYALFALARVLNAPSLTFGTFLLSRGRNWQCFVSGTIGIVLLAALSVPLTRQFGADGFGWAYVIALVDIVYLDRVVRRIAPHGYATIVGFAAVLTPPILFPLFPRPAAYAVVLPVLLLAAVPVLRNESLAVVAQVRSAMLRRAA